LHVNIKASAMQPSHQKNSLNICLVNKQRMKFHMIKALLHFFHFWAI